MESKIALTERLRHEGRWDVANQFKDREIQRLRDEGLTRREAGKLAWEAMAERFPAPSPASGCMAAVDNRDAQQTAEYIAAQVDDWAASYSLALPEAARHELVAGVVAVLFEYGGVDSIPDEYL